jgi:nicotinamide phosphoribosyltransferase
MVEKCLTMKTNNIITKTDSYKLNHWNQYPKGTQIVYSYFESRKGAKFDNTVFFGLQYTLKAYLEGVVVTREKIEEAASLCKAHFGSEKYFNREGWEYILNTHGGKLPVRIKAVPEGTPVSVSNVLMTVENTDEKCFWLTNALESLLTHVWYPSTVATLSRETKKLMHKALSITSDNPDAINFMLHDFGYRGVSSDESAAIGGAAHIINFLGTDTVCAMELARDYYGAPLDGLAYSVAATEHSIMTSRGKDGESQIVEDLLNEYPEGILSCVADSFDYYHFVTHIVGEQFQQRILNRNGVFVVRPDSVTPEHNTPESLVLWTLQTLWDKFGGKTNSKGYRVLDPHVRVLWGDGIDLIGIEKILQWAIAGGFSAENLVFGMGGGLLQKVNRDTQRFAFKSCAQKRDGVWYDIFKSPKDVSKASKRGKLKLIRELTAHGSMYKTVNQDANDVKDELEVVFEDGEIKRIQDFASIRDNAKLNYLT